MTTKSAVYARISLEQHDTGLGVERQLKDCRALAKRKGWVIAEEFIDNDVSASNSKPRQAYIALMAKLSGGTFDALLV